MIGGKFLLRGTVKNRYERDLAYKIASLYAGGGSAVPQKSQGGSSASAGSSGGLQSLGSNLGSSADTRGDLSDSVVNMLEMTNPDQINIEAMFVEISANDSKSSSLDIF